MYLRILQLCKDLLKKQDTAVLAIDGMSAAGKTTLSAKLGDELGASVIHCDDFFLPKELRTKERLEEPGGNIDYCRMKEEVVDKLAMVRKDCGDFYYQRFDCKTMELSVMVPVKQSRLYIVEGAYAMHPYFGRYYDMSLFIRISKDKQLERIQKRNGDSFMFETKWIPMENRYVEAFGIDKRADWIIDEG